MTATASVTPACGSTTAISASPHSSSGNNIFLSYGNLTDVLRQVSITGLVATGMTMVILLGGIDLSVGSVMGFATIVCAMLLTKSGWTAASIMGVPAATVVSFAAVAFLARFVFGGLARGSRSVPVSSTEVDRHDLRVR